MEENRRLLEMTTLTTTGAANNMFLFAGLWDMTVTGERSPLKSSTLHIITRPGGSRKDKRFVGGGIILQLGLPLSEIWKVG